MVVNVYDYPFTYISESSSNQIVATPFGSISLQSVECASMNTVSVSRISWCGREVAEAGGYQSNDADSYRGRDERVRAKTNDKLIEATLVTTC